MDPYRYFRVEAREILDAMARTCAALERTQGDAPLVAQLLRHAHTLKGAARIVKQVAIADRAHEVEDLLEPLRHGAPPARLDEVIARIDAMSRAVDELPRPQPQQAPAATAPPEPVHVPPADTAAVDAALASIANVLALVGKARTDVRDPDALSSRLEHVDRELREVRQDVEGLRLQPADAMFATLSRVARDAAGASPVKRVELAGTGGQLRLDPALLAAVHRALVQLVRNAVAHGIEPAAERVARGKPEAGTVAISVELRGTRVVVTCRDDGRGIDVETARRAGGLPATATTDEVIQRLLHGGVSTAPRVTEHAGRGIGLDVVRDIAREHGGTATVATTAGQGTAFVLDLPVSVAAVRALVVEATRRRVAIPLAGIRRALLVRPDALVRSADDVVVAIDDAVVPYRPIEQLLGIAAPTRARHPAIVVADREDAIALGVDRLCGVEDVLLRPPPALVRRRIEPVVLGFAFDDEGVPRMVLDPAVLVRSTGLPVLEPVPAPPPRRTVFVVDDSVTTRMLEQSILESAGYHVELAASAEDALARAELRPPALFLVDVEMPGMDGFQFVSAIRGRSALAHVPAIMVTSRDGADDRRRGEEAGAQAYVVKGELDQVALLATIRRLVK